MDENPYKAPAGNEGAPDRKPRSWQTGDLMAAILLVALAASLWVSLLP
jgi:hypothetical protein